MSVYKVTARRSGEWWALEVPELPGVFSQVKRLDQADDAAREAIAAMVDSEPEDVRVEVEPLLPEGVKQALARAREARVAAADAAAAERAAFQEAAAVLADRLSHRDAGRILGVSFQRVSQVLKERPDDGEGKRSRKARAETAGRGKKPGDREARGTAA